MTVNELESLSDFWRKRLSDIPEEELANVLDGARGYVGFFGSDFSVDWGKGSTVDIGKKRIELDFRPLKDGTPPFDGKAVDIVMGEALHECGHIKWSYPPEKVEQYYKTKQRLAKSAWLSQEEREESSELKTIANVIEDFYVENKISETYPTLGAYLREARKLDVQLELPNNLIYDLSTDEPCFDSIATMWAAIALIDKEIPKTASKTSRKLLNKLINHTLDAGKAKPQKRLQISYQIWKAINALKRARQKENERQLEQLHKKIEERQEQAPQGQGEDKPEQEQQSEGNGEPSGEDTESEGEKPDEQEEETSEDTPSSGNGDGNREDSETESEQGTEGGEEETPEETEDDKEEPATREPEEGDSEEQETENETSEGSEEDTESESEQGDSEETVEENPDEPYLDHEKLRSCYSINLDLKESMPQDLKESVDFYLDRKPEDISDQVDQIMGGAGGKEIIMELAGADRKAADKLFLETRRVAQKVSRLFMYDKKLRTRSRRGLYEGTVDVGRLYRAGSQDYKLFAQKEILSAPSLAVGILIDASGSMAHTSYYRYDTREGNLSRAVKMAMALKTALEFIEGVDLMVMSYNTVSSQMDFLSNYHSRAYTYLHRIYDKRTNEFRPNVAPNGGTPSGYAIAGMLSQIGRYLRGKDKLLIHITDGSPSSHEEVAQAVDYCLQNKVEVMTLTLARFSQVVVDSYRGMCEYLEDIEKLPDAIEALLKKRLQKRMMRIK